MRFSDLNSIGRVVALAVMTSLLSVTAVVTLGCAAFRSQPEVRAVLTAAKVAAIGLLELIEFIEGNGGDAEKVKIARDAFRKKDSAKCLAVCYTAIEDMRQAGVVIPENIDRALYMVRGAMGAQAFENVARAMASGLPKETDEPQPSSE